MFDPWKLPSSLKTMGFTATDMVDFWAARITVPIAFAPFMRQAIDVASRELPPYRISGYFLEEPGGDGHVIYQMNRIPGPSQEALPDQVLNLQLVNVLESLKHMNVPYEYQIFSVPSQEERFCILIGLGKGYSGVYFPGAQVWEVLQQKRSWQGEYQKVTIYASGGAEDPYEEPALLVACRNEVDLHWLCVALLVFWQEWAAVYDKQDAVVYRLVTALEDLRETLYLSEEQS